MTRREKLEEQYEDAYFALLMDAVAEKEGARLEELNDQLNRDPTAAVPEEIDRRCRKVINRHFAEQRRSGDWRRGACPGAPPQRSGPQRPAGA